MKRFFRGLLIACFWIVVWQIISLIVGENLLLPSPLSTLNALIKLCCTSEFYLTVLVSFGRIFCGIVMALILGMMGGILSGLLPFFRALFNPILTVIRATPVASFIVLIVLWMSRDFVPTVICILMVMPIVWSNIEEGIRTTDSDLIEMAKLYRLSLTKKITKIYIPSVYPYLLSAVRTAFGMAWKAGIAAEIICLPMISIGREIHYSSNNLQTSHMFAWTAAVILLSVFVDVGMSVLFRKLQGQKRFAYSKKLERKINSK